jgi:D-sedoheptulose 7-phosphate isomerase
VFSVKILSSASIAGSCEGPEIRSARQYFDLYKNVIDSLPFAVIDELVGELLRCYDEGRTLFLFGNGGSAALASHLACDLGKGTVPEGASRTRFRVIALTDNMPLITAWANDSSYEIIFSEQLQNLVRPGDVAFAISGSGSSPNVLAGLLAAKSAGAKTMGLTGSAGAKMMALCKLCVVIPSENMQIIEDFHLGVAHAAFTVIRQRIAEAVHARALAKATAFD